ncbi:MAG: hypothetical protein U0Q16_24750 [Bryobacteraceae bacterium]
MFRFFRVLTAALCLATCGADFPGLAAPGKPQRLEAGAQQLNSTIRSFLNAWLIERDIVKAEAFFGASAKKNEMMLQESCAGYIRPEARKSEVGRREGIRRFLKEFQAPPGIGTLAGVLNGSGASRIAGAAGSLAVNDVAKDGYILLKVQKGRVPGATPEAELYLRARLPAHSYASLVPLGGGIVRFLWVFEGANWRIFHASIVCM